jgi:hypothetical protein
MTIATAESFSIGYTPVEHEEKCSLVYVVRFFINDFLREARSTTLHFHWHELVINGLGRTQGQNVTIREHMTAPPTLSIPSQREILAQRARALDMGLQHTCVA